MDTERIKELFADESFVKQLLEQEEPEAVQALLLERDVDFSIEQIVQIRDMVEKHLKGEINIDELSDEDLEEISGGFFISAGAALVISTLLLVGSTAVGIGLGAGAVGTHAATRGRW